MSYESAFSSQSPSSNRNELSYYEHLVLKDHTNIVGGLLNEKTRAQAVESKNQLKKYYYGSQLNEVEKTIILFAVREAAKRNDFKTAFDILQATTGWGKDAVHIALAVSIERGYIDIYNFLINYDENPTSGGSSGYTLMDWLAQGRERFGDSENYRTMEQDLMRRGVRLNRRDDTCCEII